MTRRAPTPRPRVLDHRVTAGKATAVAASSLALELAIHGRKLHPKDALQRAARAAAQTAARDVATQVVAAGLERATARVLGNASVRTAAQSAARMAAQRSATSVARATLRGSAITQAAVFFVDQAIDTGRLATGSIDRAEYGRRTGENAAGAAGGVGGSVAGAALGTLLCPGAGTLVGGFIGGLVGNVLGVFGMRRVSAHGSRT